MKKTIQKILFLCFTACGFGALAQPTWLPEICNVTVDSATASYITIMWNKPATNDIDSFYIYRKVSVVYVKIAAVDYADSSVYDDIAVNVNLNAHTYAISAIDLNGIEGQKSADATTPLLDVVPNVGSGFYTCQWSNYDNFANPAINQRCIWDSLGGHPTVQIGGLMPSSWINWNHSGFSLAAGSSYRLEVFLNTSCDPSRAIVNTSRSNIKNVANPSLLIQTKEEAEKLVRAYPNPASENLMLEWNAAMGVKKIEITGLRGEVITVFTPGIDELKKTISLNPLSEGVYFVNFHSEKGIISKKIVAIK